MLVKHYFCFRFLLACFSPPSPVIAGLFLCLSSAKQSPQNTLVCLALSVLCLRSKQVPLSLLWLLASDGIDVIGLGKHWRLRQHQTDRQATNEANGNISGNISISSRSNPTIEASSRRSHQLLAEKKQVKQETIGAVCAGIAKVPAGGGAASATACPSRTACTLLDREFITPLGLPGVISTALAMGAKCLITRAKANRDNQLPEAPACSCLHSLSPSLSHTRAEVFFYDCYLANRRNRRDQPRERKREREKESGRELRIRQTTWSASVFACLS